MISGVKETGKQAKPLPLLHPKVLKDLLMFSSLTIGKYDVDLS